LQLKAIGTRRSKRRELPPPSEYSDKPDLSSALLVASLLAATALFFALALLPLAFLSLAIFVLALLSGTTRFARFVRIVL
jgi:hypothetical protein